jgi:arabinofuranosyltransferase
VRRVLEPLTADPPPPARAATWLLAAFPATFLLVQGYARRWVSEDAFIDFRVVRHLLAGHGPVFNLGERVEAYTNPLWVALLAVWSGLGGPLEWGAVGLGLCFTAAGILAAEAGAAQAVERLGGGVPGPVAWLPLGAAVFAVLPAAWDFATSGLETGLAMAWLGGGFWLLARRCPPPPGEDPRPAPGPGWPWTWTAILIGLGPLIRPDLALFAAGFLAALCLQYRWSPARSSWMGVGRLVGAAALVPVAYQGFRMGYFANLVPNTALAKEAGLAYWTQGLRYAADFEAAYLLRIPLAVALLFWALALGRAVSRRHAAAGVLLAAPVLGGLLHALYVVRVGGDFMHARLLLASVFALLTPVATVGFWPRGTGRARPVLEVGAVTLVGLWAVACAGWLRVEYAGGFYPDVPFVGRDGIGDERRFYVWASGRPNPVTVLDYARSDFARQGLEVRDRAERAAGPAATPEGRALVVEGTSVPLRAGLDARVRVVAALDNVGLAGYVAGLDAHIVDRGGLADPLASRLRLGRRGRPAHEKVLSPAWVVARFAAPEAGATDPEVVAARAALACRPLALLLESVEAPLTWRRALENAVVAWRLTGLRIPERPTAARAALCAEG